MSADRARRSARTPRRDEAPERPGLKSRQVAARLLSAVVDARTSLDGLTDPAGGHPAFRALETRDQALVKAILTTALRFRGTIERLVGATLERPLPEGAVSLRHVLHVGAAQILFLDVPDSAAVDLAVASAEADPRNRRFTGLVNAVLRRIAREKRAPASDEAFAEKLKGRAEGHAPASDGPKDGRDAWLAPRAEELKGGADNPFDDMPEWLRARLVAAYGEARARAIALAHRSPAPIDLTVKGDPATWASRLGGVALATGTVRLETIEGPITALPGFADGQWWVQDAAAALPARLLGAVDGLRVADLCAAPGGKTAQLAHAGGRVTAFDISGSRLKRLRANFERLQLPVETREGDIRLLDAEAFDRVLLDAPCSSTGTIRRHPDVAWTKNAEEVEKLAGVQAELLARAADFVAPDGLLVFSNCSLDPAEGEETIAAFLAARPEFRREPVLGVEVPGLETAITAKGDLRTTPDMLGRERASLSGLDGFFASRLRRRS